MKREKLERYIGKKVEITFYPDNATKTGIIHYGPLKVNNKKGFYTLTVINYNMPYFVRTLLFRLSHVKSIKEVN